MSITQYSRFFQSSLNFAKVSNIGPHIEGRLISKWNFGEIKSMYQKANKIFVRISALASKMGHTFELNTGTALY